MKLDSVMIWVPDVPATVAFYEKAFGMAVRMMDESSQYAQMETGAAALAFADERAAPTSGVTVRPNRPDLPAAAIQIALVADDVRAAWQRAIDAGGEEVAAPVEKPWGQLLGYVRDPNGVLVEIGSPQEW